MKGIPRLWKQYLTDAPNGCMVWTGPQDKDGYGMGWANGRSHRVVRYIYELIVGPMCNRLKMQRRRAK